MVTEESTTSVDTTAPEIAPMSALCTRPLSVANQISTPVRAPRTMPNIAKKNVSTPRSTARATRASRRETLLLPPTPPLDATDNNMLGEKDVLAEETTSMAGC